MLIMVKYWPNIKNIYKFKLITKIGYNHSLMNYHICSPFLLLIKIQMKSQKKKRCSDNSPGS